MADETPTGDQKARSKPEYLEVLMYALVGFGFGVGLIIMAPVWASQTSDLSLADLHDARTLEAFIIGVLFLIAARFGRPGGVVLCLLFLALGVWAYVKHRETKAS